MTELTILTIIGLVLLTYISLSCFADSKKYKSLDYLSHIAFIDDFFATFEKMNDEYIIWIKKDELFHSAFDALKFFKSFSLWHKRESKVKEFLDCLSDFDKYICTLNETFVRRQLEQHSDLFDNIDGKSLDEQQRRACAVDEYSNLIIAGAGSGKTLTIVGKVKYLTERRGIDPREILCLSFTQKSAAELSQRLEKAGIPMSARTFHSVGLKIIGDLEEKPGVANENAVRDSIKKYLNSEISKNPEQVSAFIQFIALYENTPEDFDDDTIENDRLASYKHLDLATLKAMCESDLHNIRKFEHNTMQGEKVKSLEELQIANHLYLQGVQYEYEKVYRTDLSDENNSIREYQPDFYLPEYDIWLEHFGINKKGRAPWLATEFEEQKYIDGIKWKRSVHKRHGTKLLESYSYWTSGHQLLPKLDKLLHDNGVVYHPRDVLQIHNRMSDMVKDKEFFKNGLGNVISTFLNLCKSAKLDKQKIVARIESRYAEKDFMYNRSMLFAQFVMPILDFYNNSLKEKGQIDFHDMINRAADLVNENDIDEQYKYIIVDEYQDASVSRFLLISALRNKFGAKVICVGDDWQSIYRFAGSDLSLFTDFENFVGQYEKLLIERTYRNSSELIAMSKNFVLKNPHQLIKNPVSDKNIVNPIIPIRFGDNSSANGNSKEDSLIEALDDIIAHQGNTADVLVLGRYNSDIDKILGKTERLGGDKTKVETDNFVYDYQNGVIIYKEAPDMHIEFLTVHKSKGLEADNVIIVNLRDSKMGFPCKIVDDPVLDITLSVSENFKYPEERRLFYVALTRTRNRVYLCTQDDRPSEFYKEIVVDNNLGTQEQMIGDGVRDNPKCKRCGGLLVIRENSKNGNQFIGCSNYPHCDKSYSDIRIINNQIDCPNCEGYMVRRNSKFGAFYGCTNYPTCKGTINIKEK